MARGQWDYLSKFVIVGDPGVGKTSLLLRLTDGRFLSDTEPTIGVEFGSHTIALTNGDRIKIQVWDTAGSETFRSLTRSYYRGAAGALLVYDVTYRRSFEHVGQWLDDLRKFADEGVSIILVGNRTDLTSDEDAQESMQEQAKQRSTNPQPGEEGTASTAALPHDVAAAANSPISEPSLAQTTAEDHPGREDVAAASSKLDSPSSSTVGRRKKRQVPKKEAAAWAEENGLLFVETSAKTGSKVEEAFASAARDIHTQFLARATCAPATPTATIRPNLETTVPRPSGAQTGCC